MDNRTQSGSPSAAARDKFGGGKGLSEGSFPVFDTKSGVDAINLRGHAPDPSAVLDKVSQYANRTNNATLKAKVKQAREQDAAK